MIQTWRCPISAFLFAILNCHYSLPANNYIKLVCNRSLKIVCRLNKYWSIVWNYKYYVTCFLQETLLSVCLFHIKMYGLSTLFIEHYGYGYYRIDIDTPEIEAKHHRSKNNIEMWNFCCFYMKSIQRMPPFYVYNLYEFFVWILNICHAYSSYCGRYGIYIQRKLSSCFNKT